MLIADMIHSCSNDKVAQAALACIGGLFAERVTDVAKKNGLSAGRFVAIVVRDFARRADMEAHAALQSHMSRADTPLLHGLRQLLEPALESGVILYDDSALGLEPHVIHGVACAGLNKFQ